MTGGNRQGLGFHDYETKSLGGLPCLQRKDEARSQGSHKVLDVL
jgi:hypothetical protein